MLTIIIKRNAEPAEIQQTQHVIMKELWQISGAEMLLEDSWAEGLKKVRTPFVCLVEADCLLSANYIASNFGIMKKTNETLNGKGGGATRFAMLASCLGVQSFENRIYGYELDKIADPELNKAKLVYWQVIPDRAKRSLENYPVQVGFLAGAIIRYSSIKKDLDNFDWDKSNLVELSTELSFHFWRTGRTIKVNPNTTYVSQKTYLEAPPKFKLPDIHMNLYTEAAELFAMTRKR